MNPWNWDDLGTSFQGYTPRYEVTDDWLTYNQFGMWLLRLPSGSVVWAFG